MTDAQTLLPDSLAAEERLASWVDDIALGGHPLGQRIETPVSALIGGSRAIRLPDACVFGRHPSALSKRRILLLEPHADDVALSIGGMLLDSDAHILVCTVFSSSEHVSERFRVARTWTRQEVTDLRTREIATYCSEVLRADSVSLGLREAEWPWQPAESGRVEEVVREVSSAVDLGGYEIWAPSGRCRHPDHQTTFWAGRELGATAFWEDTSNNGGYADSWDEQVLLDAGGYPNFDWKYVDISRVWHHKVANLALFGSQFEGSRQMVATSRHARALGLTSGFGSMVEAVGSIANDADRRPVFI